jgi:hypothetical protein
MKTENLIARTGKSRRGQPHSKTSRFVEARAGVRLLLDRGLLAVPIHRDPLPRFQQRSQPPQSADRSQASVENFQFSILPSLR